jgi:hypothetical protein
LGVISCTVSNNSAASDTQSISPGDGGGIYNTLGSATVTILNSTLSGNQVNSGDTIVGMGGAVYSAMGLVMLANCTLSGNTAGTGTGGGIALGAGKIAVFNTLVAGNTAGSAADVAGAINSLGHNLVGIGAGGSGYADTDLVGTSASPLDPMLGPLQDNGGPTPTMALLPESPAIDSGSLTDSEWDQRGPGYPRLVNGATDIGAYEVQPRGGSAAPEHGGGFLQTRILMPERELNRAGTSISVAPDAASQKVPTQQTAVSVDRFFAACGEGTAWFVRLRFGQEPRLDAPEWIETLVRMNGRLSQLSSAS